MKLYGVKINLRDGTTWNITGDETTLDREFSELVEALNVADGCGEKYVEFHGISDSAARSELRYIFEVEAIQAASFGPWE